MMVARRRGNVARSWFLIASAVVAAAFVAVTASGGVTVTRAGASFAGGEGPAWSPDGTQIVYIAPARTAYFSGNLGLDHVAVINANSSGPPHTVAKAPRNQTFVEVRWGVGGHFIYSDSNHILWDSTGDTNPNAAKRIATVGDTGGVGVSFALSRDGREIAFTAPCKCASPQGNTVGVVPVMGGKARILVHKKNELDEYPSFSPDGKRVIFTRILAGSRGPTSLLNSELVIETFATGAQRVIHTLGQWAAFSPNGHSIAFFGTHGLEVIPSSGGTPQTLLPFGYVDGTASFAWSPNSQTLAYITETKIGTVDLSGHAATFAIPGLRPNLDTPQWSLDGKTIAFSAISNGAQQEERVYLINGDGAGLRRIA
jgi:Tol biopolymer transport system component